jgi:glycosyltransferase involved in cell wall biosynthesis
MVLSDYSFRRNSAPERMAKILVLCDYFDPAYLAGGPIKSIQNLVLSELAAEMRFFVVSRDRDIGVSDGFNGIPTGRWLPYGEGFVMYVRPKMSSLFGAIREARRQEYDVIYLNSVFSIWFSIIILLLRWTGTISNTRLVLAPRGELSRAALRIKPRRKRLYLSMARMMNLYRSVTWHASTELEAGDVQATFGNTSVIESVVPLPRIASNENVGVLRVLTAADLVKYTFIPRQTKADGPGRGIRVAFLSRICKMKNLEVAIAAVIRAAEELDCPLVFDIYGPAEDRDYWARCQKMIQENRSKAVITYFGPVLPDDVATTMAAYHVFLLPTQGENFGHVIAEALSAGCIVLTSTHTPWSAIEEYGCGYCAPSNTPREYSEFLVKLYNSDLEEIDEKCRLAQNFFLSKWDKEAELHRYRKLFGVCEAAPSVVAEGSVRSRIGE